MKLIRLLALIGSACAGLTGGPLDPLVTLQHTGNTWEYSLLNNYEAESDLWLGSFKLDLNASVTEVMSPAGWEYWTDSATFVIWYNADSLPPYEHDIAPGAILGGFIILSSGSEFVAPLQVAAWDHVLDTPGPLYEGVIATPFSVGVPEPSSLILLGSAIGIFISARIRNLCKLTEISRR